VVLIGDCGLELNLDVAMSLTGVVMKSFYTLLVYLPLLLSDTHTVRRLLG
jgi:hypothetical protein